MIDDRRFQQLLETRAKHPARIAEAAAARQRRPWLREDGRLFIVAADHPGRGIVGVGSDPVAMADRRDLLRRVLVALDDPGVDGVLATPDIMEELLLLDALHERIALGSMNRAGLAGSAWELDDRFTGYDVASLEAARLDGGKMLLRIDHDDPATVTTLETCAHAVSDLARVGLPAVVEPLPAVRGEDGKLHIRKEPNALIQALGVAAALGVTSAYTWLKLPVVDEMERVLAATTMPVLLLGGDPGGRAAEVFAGWRRAMEVPQTRGLVAGRSLLYPPDGDVARAVGAAAELVHG